MELIGKSNDLWIFWLEGVLFTLRLTLNNKQYITGQCTEYDRGGNSIQRNEVTDCTGFTQKPCPKGYNSSEMFKCKIHVILYICFSVKYN